ncbi:MAG: hypothetical protein ACREON_15305 [Gemmatimonadaceae bacterium]
MRSYRSLGMVSMALALAACDADLPPSPESDVTITAKKAASAPAASPENNVARGIALALREHDVRVAIRDAMRASRFTEHKLVLQEFIQTEAGRAVVAAAAASSGLSESAFRSLIDQLPPLDFYVSRRDDRKSWRASANVEVAIVMNERPAKFDIFRPDGRALALTPEEFNVRGSSRATLMLHPAESKSLRVGAQPDVPGEVISDPGDGEWGGHVRRYRPDGTTVDVQLAHLIPSAVGARAGLQAPETISADEECGPTAIEECGSSGSGGGATSPRDTTLLRAYVIIETCDYLDCGQGNEFEWRAHFFRDGVRVDRRDIRIEEVPSAYESPVVNYPLIFQRVKRFGERIVVDIVETDVGSDDEFFPSPVLDEGSDNGRLFNSGGIRCGPFGTRYDCTGMQPEQFWRQVNSDFRWTPTGF